MTILSNFIFVHGWGVDSSFWDRLISLLPVENVAKIDLGFLGKEQKLPETLNQALDSPIYVTHSLGTAWALKNHCSNIRALISINGFYCFKKFAPKRSLLAMKTRLKRNPAAQMEEFWEAGGLPEGDDFNVKKLQDGLDWLMSWDARAELEKLNCPVLSLAGSDDPILPVGTMKKQWAGFDMYICEGGGHALPLSDSQWCADRIKEFCGEFCS